MSSKRSTAYVAAIGLLGVAVLAISVVTLIKVYSADPPAVSDGGAEGKAYNELNLPQPLVLSQENDVQYKAYSEFAKRLHGSVDPGVNPCEDFYAYTCGKFNNTLSYVDVNVQNFRLVANQLGKQEYVNYIKTPKPVKQAAIFHSKCVEAMNDWASKTVDGQKVVKKINAFSQIMNVTFPALNASQDIVGLPSGVILGYALGYLSYTERLNTLLSFSIETNWKDPHGKQPYAFYIDQTELVYPDVFYLKLWDDIKEDYSAEITNMLTSFAKFNNTQVDEALLKEDVRKIMDLEWKIATQVNTPAVMRRSFERSYNPFNISAATSKFNSIDFYFMLREALYHTPKTAIHSC
uniref:Peptidase M13 N-terminal domain-containing protein n=1 Tax=Ditylenchus dipsaci TaxID=166011 RepID=A0A915EP33_9BILA